MSNELRSRLESARSWAILTEAAVLGGEATADKIAAALVEQCHEIERAKQRYAEAKQSLAQLEQAIAISDAQAPLVDAFKRFSARVDPKRVSQLLEVAKA